jgi:hypothetical protein
VYSRGDSVIDVTAIGHPAGASPFALTLEPNLLRVGQGEGLSFFHAEGGQFPPDVGSEVKPRSAAHASFAPRPAARAGNAR